MSRERRYALLGWLVWSLAKRRLRRAAGRPPSRRVFRAVGAVAVMAALFAAWARRAGRSAPVE